MDLTLTLLCRWFNHLRGKQRGWRHGYTIMVDGKQFNSDHDIYCINTQSSQSLYCMECLHIEHVHHHDRGTILLQLDWSAADSQMNQSNPPDGRGLCPRFP